MGTGGRTVFLCGRLDGQNEGGGIKRGQIIAGGDVKELTTSGRGV